MNTDKVWDRLSAQNAGYDAYRAKVKLSDNPYPMGDIKHDMWERGWMEANEMHKLSFYA
jgi:hypothetical protein